VLTVHAPDRVPWTVRLVEGKEYAIGRDPTADVVLDHSWVSLRHASIIAGDPPYIVDVGSRNATFVDGRRLESFARVRLAPGTLIAIGAFSLHVSRGEAYITATQRRATAAVTSGDGVPLPAASACQAAPIVRDARMLELYAFARKVAKSSLNVLVTGETGAGKELLAQAIHESSWRGQRPLVTLNCAALPENLVESELFGYERGAFSGAAAAKPGLFEVADGSTIFLDEIGELPLQVQAKLLRVLEMREVQRLGAVRPTRVDVRVVAATNRHLLELVAAGSFRADLFYRLNGLTLSIPALRERPDDIEALALHFAAQASGHSVRLTRAARELLRTYAWPGNVRELKSVLERAVLVCHKEELDAADLDLESTSTLPKIPVALPLPGKPQTSPRESEDKEPFTTEEVPTNLMRAELERRERRHIKEALERTGGNQSEAAVLLGISRRTLMNRMDRYGMNRPRKGARRGEDG